MTKNQTLPSVCLDASAFEPKLRWEAWQSFNSGLFQLERNSLPDQDMHAKAMSYRIGDTILGEYSVSGNIVRRKVSRFVVEREDLLVLRMHRAGFTKGVMDERSFEMKPSHLTLFDFHQPFHANTENVDYASFTFPYSAVHYDPSRHPRFLQIPVNTSAGRILRSNFQLMLDLIPLSSVEDAFALSDGFCGLLKSLIIRDFRDETQQERFVQSRRVAVRRFIEENLRDPGLDVARVCDAVGISRAVLYRMFEEEGSVRRAVQKKRLEGALDELAQSAPTRGLVARVARHWAFSDQAHFPDCFGTRSVSGQAMFLEPPLLPPQSRAASKQRRQPEQWGWLSP